ncbi:uncharacterized protein LOC120824813 isoform X2 [Gasterosteus aculeatus]
MWPTETPTRAAGLLCVLLAVVSASTEITIYRKLGDGVVLRPVNISVSSTIVWKQDGNLAAEWEGAEITLYRDFKGRGRLNTSNGELTITGLTPKENGFYTLETKEMAGPKIHLIVISPVPKPTVSKQCDPDRTLCTLSCDGDVADAAPVTYRWSPGDTAASKELRLAKEDSWEVQEFRCVLQNPVSQESSEPVPNPFSKAPVRGPNFSTGGVVFAALLVAVLLLAAAHRCTTGMWFFQKTSMPWEPNFWRKNERPSTDGSVSNGTAVQERGQSDEETPLS